MPADPVRDWLTLQGWQVDTRQGPALRWSAWRGMTLVLARHDGWVVRIEDGSDRVERKVVQGRFVGAAIEAVEPEQVTAAYRFLRREDWVAKDRSVTEAGRSEASRRRDVQARVTGGEVDRG